MPAKTKPAKPAAPITTAVPGTGKRKRYNPEKRDWKGRSHRKGGKRIRDLRATLVAA